MTNALLFFEEESFVEVMTNVRTSSHVLILDFSEIPPTIAHPLNIRSFFEECAKKGIDPKLPAHRQAFNERCLAFLKKRYLIGRYGEDRRAMIQGTSIAREGRTIHLGVDLFCADLEEVFAPFEGRVVRKGFDPGNGYGYYLIVEHILDGKKWWSFFGHLGKDMIELGPVKTGQCIGRIGDYVSKENGGWSKHLHYQILLALPPDGLAPLGYSTPEKFIEMQKMYPNPGKVLGIILSQPPAA